MSSRSRTCHVSLGVIVAAVLTLATPALAQAPATCNTDDTNAPCFANVPDILNGKTKLLPNDDLIVNTNSVNTETGNLNVYPTGGNLSTTSSAITGTAATTITNTNASIVSNQLTIQGRLFAVDHDQVLSATVNQTSSGGQGLVASLEQEDSGITIPPMPALNNATMLYGAAADFLGNGYAQMVIVGAQPGSGQIVLQPLAAYDPLIPGDGITVGTEFPIPTNSTVFAVTAGIFTQPSGNATGPARPTAQLAVLSTNSITNQGLVLTFFAVNANLTITPVGSPYPLSLPTGTPATPSTIAIAAGRFTGGNHDQLGIAYPVFPTENNPVGVAQITTVDFNAQGNPSQQTANSTGFPISSQTPASGYSAALYLAKGSFNWAGGSDQLGVSVGTDGRDNSYIGVMSFNSQLAGTMGAPVEYAGACHFGLAAGNFDSGGFNLQLADTASNCQPGVFNANIYNVDPNTFAVTLESVADISSILNAAGSSSPPIGAGSLAVSLIAGDEQGRSLLLGPPEKLTITSHYQPDFVLEVPPMHVDWVVPNGGSAVGITNVTVYPGTFNASLNYSSGSMSMLMQQTKTSYTYSTKVMSSEGASYGIPGEKVSLMATQAATQMHQNTVSANYDTNMGLSRAFTFTTVLDDIVSSTQSNLNVYSYPVLGQCDTGAAVGGVCPDGGSPLYVQYSGSDNVYYTLDAPGSTEEWYQPVHEPGNLLSYPASATMLESIVNNQGLPFNPLTPTNNNWNPLTQGSTNVNWTEGTSAGATTGSTSSHSFNTSVSASASVNFEGFGGSASGSFDYNDSTSVSTLNQSVNSFSSSLGVTQNYGISTGGLDQAYSYQGNTLVYSQTNSNVIQTDLAPPTSIQAQGFIDVGQTADILFNESANQWWKQTYGSLPDIALNHPARWNSKALTAPQTGEVVWENCPYLYQASVSSPECASNTPKQTPVQGYATYPYYLMKGLFITPGGTSNGPQTAIVQQGGSLNLRARVYNYSLVNYQSYDQLVVQFYAQQYNGTTGAFVDDPVGSGQFAQAVYLGTGSTQDNTNNAPPSAYCGGTAGESDPCPDSTTNNYKNAYLTWDTTSNAAFAADTYWVIWVVAWVVNTDTGLLEPEPTGHGFTTLPASSTQFHDPSQVPIELYSNNLGIYNQVVSIIGASSSTTPAASSAIAGPAAREAATTPAAKKLTLGKISTNSSSPVLRYQPTAILAPHVVTGDHVDSIFTEYFDGDPDKGGTVFDTQHVPHVVGGSQYVDRALFRPQTCGEHEIFVRAVPMDGSAATATAKAMFKVTDDPVGSIDSMITFVKSPAYPPRSRAAILRYLNVAKQTFMAKRTLEGIVEMKILLKLVQDGAFGLPENVQQVIVNQINDLLGCL
jgi:hypothetical protein